MKFILALLLGLSSAAFIPELDWDDSEEAEAKNYNGIIVQVYQGDNAAPSIALGSDYDDYEHVYCLNLVRIFEAESYDTASGVFSELADSSIALEDANCTVNEKSMTMFDIKCDNVGDATLRLSFEFTADNQGDYGLEYVITLSGYEMANNETKLVFVQSVKDCSSLYQLDSDSVEEDVEEEVESTDDEEEEVEDDNEDDEGTQSDTEEEEEGGDDATGSDTEDTEDRRRLSRENVDTEDVEHEDDTEDTEDEEQTDDQTQNDDQEESPESVEEEEDDGESDSDEEGEIDVGFARFVSNGQALDRCEGQDRQIDSAVVFQITSSEVHLVFDHFECELVLDPFYGLDESKYVEAYPQDLAVDNDKEDAAHAVNVVLITSVIALLSALAF